MNPEHQDNLQDCSSRDSRNSSLSRDETPNSENVYFFLIRHVSQSSDSPRHACETYSDAEGHVPDNQAHQQSIEHESKDIQKLKEIHSAHLSSVFSPSLTSEVQTLVSTQSQPPSQSFSSNDNLLTVHIRFDDVDVKTPLTRFCSSYRKAIGPTQGPANLARPVPPPPIVSHVNYPERILHHFELFQRNEHIKRISPPYPPRSPCKHPEFLPLDVTLSNSHESMAKLQADNKRITSQFTGRKKEERIPEDSFPITHSFPPPFCYPHEYKCDEFGARIVPDEVEEDFEDTIWLSDFVSSSTSPQSTSFQFLRVLLMCYREITTRDVLLRLLLERYIWAEISSWQAIERRQAETKLFDPDDAAEWEWLNTDEAETRSLQPSPSSRTDRFIHHSHQNSDSTSSLPPRHPISDHRNGVKRKTQSGGLSPTDPLQTLLSPRVGGLRTSPFAPFEINSNLIVENDDFSAPSQRTRQLTSHSILPSLSPFFALLFSFLQILEKDSHHIESLLNTLAAISSISSSSHFNPHHAPPPIIPPEWPTSLFITSLDQRVPLTERHKAEETLSETMNTSMQCDLLSVDVKEMARQITLIEANLFLKVESVEFVELGWMKGRDRDRSTVEPAQPTTQSPSEPTPEPTPTSNSESQPATSKMMPVPPPSISDTQPSSPSTAPLQQPSSPNRPTPSSNLRNLILHFNRMSLWISTCILTPPTPLLRAQVLEYFIALCSHFVELHNFVGVMEVVTGLQRMAIRRLAATWDLVSKPLRVEWQKMEELTDLRGRFRNLRKQMQSSPPPLVPYFGVFLTDLVYVNEAKNVTPQGKVHLKKLDVEWKVIADIKKTAMQPYALHPVGELWGYLMKARGLDEDALLELSLKMEPREELREET
ncbi:putative Ras-specific guanine nucleotide-releasing factor 2 [Blattamonas nauphoetae]|uniref:Ras-specific guanine nucleotide-releasing factor 2 n=1 Tax=Blattamonas nauphoetae TaxID=2049346 RepID=A0ABQ9XMB3_9EUKA|nr:putative Ras-specific guanine nucleotide-releasing factor 2 [Blattamonas nauphoetae]